jgi:formylglycine-generating enzyme required for sulfatase activity
VARLLARLLTKRTLAVVSVLALVGLVVWVFDKVRHGPREVEPGDEAVAARVLVDLPTWDAASCAERRAAAVWVGRTTPGFGFERLERFGEDEHRHEIAVYTHAATGLEFGLILGGTFQMGSPEGEVDRISDETQHAMTVARPFLICRTETTQVAWERVMATNPSMGTPGADHPVENVSWDDAEKFCRKAGLQLPSEAQWEYACRAGTTTRYWSGDGEEDLARVGWYDENTLPSNGIVQRALRWAGMKPPAWDHRPVAGKAANPFGLFDMHGNVWEWCEDTYDSEGAPSDGSARVDPAASLRVIRGGSWHNPAGFLRCAFRYFIVPGLRITHIGFRPARSVTPK